jgi:hypothetical protein
LLPKALGSFGRPHAVAFKIGNIAQSVQQNPENEKSPTEIAKDRPHRLSRL